METLARSIAAPARDVAGPGIGDSPFLDRRPLAIRPQDSAARALSAMLARNAYEAVVLDAQDRYLGMVTLRSLADLALLVSAQSTRLMPRLDYHREDVAALASRLAAKGDIAAADLLDRAVPVLQGSLSLPQALAVLIRQPPVAAVLAGSDGALLGVVTLERALRALHARSGFAAHHTA